MANTAPIKVPSLSDPLIFYRFTDVDLITFLDTYQQESNSLD